MIFILLAGGAALAHALETEASFSKLKVKPGSLHFKTIDLSTNPAPESLILTVSNSGTETLSVTVNPPSVGPFSITSGGGAVVIPPKGSAPVIVEFAPTVSQKYTAAISVPSGATKGKTAETVKLSGTASGTEVLGTIFVTNASADSVTEYPLGSNGNVAPIAVISGDSTGLNQPGGIAVDSSSGDIYVSNYSASAEGNITVFSPGSNGNDTPGATIIGGGGFYGVALDSSGNIYSAVDGVKVSEYPAGSNGMVEPIATILGLDASGVAVDSNRNIYVANPNVFGGASDTGVLIYPPGSNGDAFFVAEIGGVATGLNEPYGIALDSKGKIYVTNYSGGPTNGGSITIYPPWGGNTGVLNEAPIVTIAGPKTGLNEPTGIAVDLSGNIYVANVLGAPDERVGNGSITVYRAGSSGNVTPIATISAPLVGADATMLDVPVGVAVGPIAP